MTHLLDTDICSAFMRRPGGLAHRFFQYASSLAISSVTLGELYSGANQKVDPPRHLVLFDDLLVDAAVFDFDSVCAEQFGVVRGPLLRGGIRVPMADLMIASVALVHDLTLVTHGRLRIRSGIAPGRLVNAIRVGCGPRRKTT